jgi:hypothetical protein
VPAAATITPMIPARIITGKRFRNKSNFDMPSTC